MREVAEDDADEHACSPADGLATVDRQVAMETIMVGQGVLLTGRPRRLSARAPYDTASRTTSRRGNLLYQMYQEGLSARLPTPRIEILGWAPLSLRDG